MPRPDKMIIVETTTDVDAFYKLWTELQEQLHGSVVVPKRLLKWGCKEEAQDGHKL